MCAGPEGASGIDDDGCPPRRRLLPRWPDPERADRDAVMELPPPLLPPLLDVACRDVAEGRAYCLLAFGVAVADELEDVAELALFEAVGEELEHPGARS